MSIGSLKTLYTSLAADLLAQGVTLTMGEENIAGLSVVPPLVNMVPVGGPWTETGYAAGTDPDQGATFMSMTTERIDFYCYGFSSSPSAMNVDHYDAVETIRDQLLVALDDQTPTGLQTTVFQGSWVTASNEITRFGRAYVLSVNIDISVPGLSPVDATVTTVTVNASI